MHLTSGMESKFQIPSPNFNKNLNESRGTNSYYLTPCGMTLLPRSKQPPPMYGVRGSTVPGKFFKVDQQQNNIRNEIESSPPPRSEYCSDCNMELASAQDMKRHMNQHETCPAEDCNFEALPSIIEQHIEAKHITGLYKTVKKVWTPENIAAWRAERSKRFPTVASVEIAKQAKEQRLKRGERLEASKRRFGQLDDRRRTRPSTTNCGKHVKKQADKVRTPQTRNDRKRTKTMENEITLDESKSSAFMFRGTSKMSEYKHVKTNNQNHALNNMLAMYGTDSETEENGTADGENEDEVDVTPVATIEETKESLVEPCVENITVPATDINVTDVAKHDVTPVATIEETKESLVEPCVENITVPVTDINVTDVAKHESSSSDEGPEELPITRQAEPIPSAPQEAKKTTATEIIKPNGGAPVKRVLRRKLHSGLNYKRARQLSTQNTMLSKLLAPDIRHERNVLLQCVRYVCEHNFFDIGKLSAQISNSKDIKSVS